MYNETMPWKSSLKKQWILPLDHLFLEREKSMFLLRVDYYTTSVKNLSFHSKGNEKHALLRSQRSENIISVTNSMDKALYV